MLRGKLPSLADKLNKKSEESAEKRGDNTKSVSPSFIKKEKKSKKSKLK